MIELCRMNTLTVDHLDDRGIWLRGVDEPIALSRREFPDARPGLSLRAFVFRDSTGHLRATRREPLVQAGEFAMLTVTSVTEHGAFLDWGMEKDLLAPHSLQPERMQEGRSYMVRVEIDRQERPFADARIEEYLEGGPGGLSEGDEVELLFWRMTDLGAMVIVNQRFAGLLYRDELRDGLRPGTCVTGYVKRLRPDGKIDVTLRKVGAEGVEEAKEVILNALRRSGGFLPLHDQSAPKAIGDALGISKKTFKKAVGGLYKNGSVELTADGIRLKGK